LSKLLVKMLIAIVGPSGQLGNGVEPDDTWKQ
jgi:hypothetical protein